MAALDFLEKLDGIDAHELDPLQRILLITDGTLTEILEAHFFEPIRLIKLSQKIVPASDAHAELRPNGDEKFMERIILLRGGFSGKVYVYAKSVIAHGRLDADLRDELLGSDVPLGRLWLKYRLETFKELIGIDVRPASDLGRHFSIEASSPLLARSYRVFTGGKPVMRISEYFAVS